MSLAELFTIGCFISLNPSPIHWTVSGGEAEVAAVTEIAEGLPAVRLVAHTSETGTGFARFEFAADAPYRAVARLIYEVQRRRLLISLPRPLVPSCEDGGVDEVGHIDHPVTAVWSARKPPSPRSGSVCPGRASSPSASPMAAPPGPSSPILSR